ncbi:MULTISPECIES: hypothetical protein [Enterobacterales]|uniref:hypothetical protein n=1 Tax=Enterobacterales TaxID=91347 RepID=UPI0020057F1B|nr:MULTISPECIES: hypothetical protein [Enterobacterales]MCK6745237.1 hypothetical protein [Enterobacter cloacae]WOP85270.1 hypothetical protein R0291_22370 [Citrobacter koseri]
MNHHQKNQKPAQASSKANVEAQSLRSYRVEASTTNPETRAHFEHLHDYHVAICRKKANGHARNFWTAGYWVEVYDNETNELLAGPIDPDSPLPSYIV